MTQQSLDPRIATYLEQLRAALWAAPPGQQQEIFDEVSSHISAELNGREHDPLAVAEVLDRLGDPAEIAREADTNPRSAAWIPAHPTSAPGKSKEIVAVIMLTLGGLVLPGIGWLVGVILLWLSDRFTTADKWLGTFFAPAGAGIGIVILGLAGLIVAPTESCNASGGTEVTFGPNHVEHVHQLPVTESCSGKSHALVASAVFLLLLAVALFGFAIYVAVRLIRRVIKM